MLRIARQENVTQIILGKPLTSWWAAWIGRFSPVDTLVRTSGEIDIHLVQPAADPGSHSNSERRSPAGTGQWKDSLKALAIACVVTVVGLLTHDFVGY